MINLNPLRGEFVGDGIPRTAGGHPYNPLAGGYTFDDDCYWESCTELREIRDFAVWHMVSPYAVLACVLARIVAATPPHIVLPALVGASYGSLNFGVVLLGGPSSGKDTAYTTAEHLVPDVRSAYEGAPATGQAVSAIFARRSESGSDGDGYRTEFVNGRAILRYTEISTLQALMGRKESTLRSTLLDVFSGHRIGETTKDRSLSVVIPDHGYRGIPVISAQPSSIDVFTNGYGVGLQQRFLYVSALSDRIANLRVDFRDTTPEPVTTMFPCDQGILPADLPAEIMGKVYSEGGYGNLALEGMEDARYELKPMTFPKIVEEHVIFDRIRTNSMDSPASPTAHSTYMRMKLAAAMHLLRLGSGGDPLVVSEEDWELAGVLADDSAKTFEDARKQSDIMRSERMAERMKLTDDASDVAETQRAKKVEDRIISLLENAPSHEISRRSLHNSISKRQREVLSPALENLMRSGRVRASSKGAGGEWYKLI